MNFLPIQRDFHLKNIRILLTMSKELHRRPINRN